MSEAPPEDPHQIRILPQPMTPLAHEDGSPRRFGPWKPAKDACSVCPARCCRMTVRCSVADVVRFCAVLDLPWQASFRLIPGDSPESFPVAEGGAIDFALRQDDNGDCANLVDHGGFFRCGAYEARPSPCRLYPVSYDAKTRRGGVGYVLCPVPYAITPRREAELRADIAASIEGWALHAEIRVAWIAEGDGAAASLPGFALRRAAAARGLDPGPLVDDRPPHRRLADRMRETKVLR